jgi:hypothetical protein
VSGAEELLGHVPHTILLLIKTRTFSRVLNLVNASQILFCMYDQDSGFGGLEVACWLWYPSSRVRTRPKPWDF